MQLVIAEKPSVAQSIAAALGVKEKKDGYIEGGAASCFSPSTWQSLSHAPITVGSTCTFFATRKDR